MWELSIRDVRHTDEGMYECQLTTHPPVSLFFTLEVVEAQAKIKGPPELHIHFGSKLLLHCEVELATEPPMYVFWYHNETMINYDRTRELHIQKRGYSSSLAIHNVTWTEAGVYTCDPHLAKATNITVHVGMGHHPIALQRDRGEVTPSRAPSSTISFFSSTQQQHGLVLKLHLLLLFLLPFLSSLHSISFFTSFEPRI
ncbi:uncharacterized protein LOC143030499 [Oratosquilla oratoria]|uniref:uncharacterized protein LOC143030499 n=1 Tax=Oratosquilla oratoria TaxID=337810 RepID=UPI003F771F67